MMGAYERRWRVIAERWANLGRPSVQPPFPADANRVGLYNLARALFEPSLVRAPSGLPVPLPYPIARLGHAHKSHPNNGELYT